MRTNRLHSPLASDPIFEMKDYLEKELKPSYAIEMCRRNNIIALSIAILCVELFVLMIQACSHREIWWLPSITECWISIIGIISIFPIVVTMRAFLYRGCFAKAAPEYGLVKMRRIVTGTLRVTVVALILASTSRIDHASCIPGLFLAAITFWLSGIVNSHILERISLRSEMESLESRISVYVEHIFDRAIRD